MYYDDKYNDEIRRFESKQKEAIIAMAVCLDLIKYKNEDNLLIVLRNLIDHYKSNNKIRIEVDFNPNNI